MMPIVAQKMARRRMRRMKNILVWCVVVWREGVCERERDEEGDED
jgi:hypothetical protein